MTELINCRRPSAYLGGPRGSAPATTTLQERQVATEKILRYRYIVLDYALAMARVAVPEHNEIGWEAPKRLIHWLEVIRPAPTDLPGGRIASATELGTVQDLPLLDDWRKAALAAVAGRERELPYLEDRLEYDHSSVVLRDVADLTLALLHLDARYFSLPGWQRLGPHSKWQDGYNTKTRRVLDSSLAAAQLCSKWGRRAPDEARQSLDQLGYRAPTPLLPKPYPSGIDGAIGALHNAYVLLGAEFPCADAITAIARVQRKMSALALEIAYGAGDARRAEAFGNRAATYVQLLTLLTERVAGPAGGGARAVREGELALRALETAISNGHAADGDQLDWLHSLSKAIDTRIAARMHQGFTERRFYAWTGYALSGFPVRGVMRTVRKYEPITERSFPSLMNAVRQLAPEGRAQVAPIDATQGRDEFTALMSRPDAHGKGRKALRARLYVHEVTDLHVPASAEPPLLPA